MSYPIQTNMARSTFLLLLPPLLLLVVLFSTPTASSSSSGSPTPAPTPTPTPTPWPPQFHATLFENYKGNLSTIELWYDWPNGRNFNIIRAQLSPDEAVVYDLEWNNGTSFIFSLGGPSPTCRTLHPGVGILRRDWLDGAHYLGTKELDGFLCHVWEKEQFIWYYEDVSSKRPVYWQFYTGRSMHVMNYELGAALEDEKWQAPAHCFENSTKEDGEKENFIARGRRGAMSKALLGEFASLKKSMGLNSA